MQAVQQAPSKLSYSIREAVAATSLSRSTIYNHITAGRLRVVKIAGRTLIPADALLSFVNGEG